MPLVQLMGEENQTDQDSRFVHSSSKHTLWQTGPSAGECGGKYCDLCTFVLATYVGGLTMSGRKIKDEHFLIPYGTLWSMLGVPSAQQFLVTSTWKMVWGQYGNQGENRF